MRRAALILALSLVAPAAYAGDPEALLRNMKPAWKKVSDYTTEWHVRQRVGGELYAAQISLIKFRKPFDIYAKRLNEPNQNAEAIYRGASWNGGKVRACKGSFPNVTISIDPFGKLAMIDQNHPMPHFYLGYFIDRMLGDLTRAQAEGVAALTELGVDSVDGRACTKVGFSTNPKAGASYTPKKGDSWASIAKATGSDWTALRYANEGKKPDDPAAALFAPTYYASKWEICVDDTTGLPIAFQSWDAAGKLFESYTLKAFKVNLGLGDLDFDPENSAYGF
jgi:hypothetical protein